MADKHIYLKKRAQCGVIFEAVWRNSRYCSNACRRAKLLPWRRVAYAAALVALAGQAPAQGVDPQAGWLAHQLYLLDAFASSCKPPIGTYEACVNHYKQQIDNPYPGDLPKVQEAAREVAQAALKALEQAGYLISYDADDLRKEASDLRRTK